MSTKTTAITNFTTAKRKINDLLSLQKIAWKDIEDFSKMEREYLGELLSQKLSELTGDERETFIDKIELIIQPETKSNIWENNHAVISGAISNFVRQHGYMPAKSAIAQETGLSRQTVTKHFKEYKTNPEYQAEMEQFKFMAPRILASVFKNAANGDMKAARLYFDMVGATNKQQPGMVVNAQNNYIQINNTILSQENLRQLSAEQLNQIENIVTNNLGG